MTGHFTALDAVVLLVYLVGVTWLGIYLGRGRRTARDYFAALFDHGVTPLLSGAQFRIDSPALWPS